MRARRCSSCLVARRTRSSAATAAAGADHATPQAVDVRHSRARVLAAVACALLLAAYPGTAAATPAPCGDVAQITDVSGDGHHPATDVLGAWFSEASGHLQAVIKVRAGTWAPEHDDAEINGSGFALLWTAGGQTRFVRTLAPPAGAPITFDYGTYTQAGGFAPAGATTGDVVYATGGATTIDVPAALGVIAGAVLTDPFVLTYDGITGGNPDWVDHAPGGVSPTEAAFGADYVVGSCAAAPTPGGGDPGTTPDPGTPAGTPGSTGTTAVQLIAPRTLTGGGTATVSGRIVPARAGVTVTITRRARVTVVTRLTTAADGSFRARIPVGETTRLRAQAGGLGSQELQVLVRSTARITVRRLRSGATVVRGVTAPGLPGRVLLLRTDSATPSARADARGGRFSFHLPHAVPGRYQAVYIPSGGRAERSTSNTGVIR